MLESTKLSALESAARIAGLATIAGGLACQPKQAAPVAPVTPSPAAEPAPEESNTAVPEIPALSEESVDLKPPAAFPDNFDSCKTALTSASKDPASFNFEKIPENVDSCCAEYVKFLSDNRRMSGEFHGFCCNVLDWQGGAACTPWGPPTPPAFPRR